MLMESIVFIQLLLLLHSKKNKFKKLSYLPKQARRVTWDNKNNQGYFEDGLGDEPNMSAENKSFRKRSNHFRFLRVFVS